MARPSNVKQLVSLLLVAAMFVAGCGSDSSAETADAVAETSSPSVQDTATVPTTAAVTTEPAPTDVASEPADDAPDLTETTETTATTGAEAEGEAAAGDAELTSFTIEVWADNWSAVYVDGVLVGEDSVPITTERSFNAETFVFEASTPFTVAIEAKDFKQTDSGIEYIGLQNQQMGDGGIIAQITDQSTGEVVAVTNAAWSALVVHQAPLNSECERDADPDATCEYLIIDTPADWADADFDDSSWAAASEWSAAAVAPKDGYNEIAWDASAQLIWGADLEVDNTVLLRFTVE